MPLPPNVVLPEGKPYHEWVRGKLYPKVSPSTAHGRLQVKIAALLLAWGEERGVVATELDMDVTPAPGDTRRYLPDVEFTSFEALTAAGQRKRQIPEISPELGIEILSPRDDRAYLADKVAAYLAAGSSVIIVVDPTLRTFAVHRANGSVETLRRGDIFTDEVFPGLRLEITSIFAILDR
jgi:Uma2 family endonuclease